LDAVRVNGEIDMDAEQHELVAKLKRQAKAQYLEHERLVYRANASCGLNLLAVLNVDVSQAATEFNRTMDLLAKIDKEAPVMRLPTGT